MAVQFQDIAFEFLHHEMVSYFTSSKKIDGEEDLSQLEYAGYSCGYRIIERLTKEWHRFKEELEIMKFVCTDFWSAIYKKQIDNLLTNHQGVYLLVDNEFRFFNNISNGTQYLENASKYATFTCGLIRGALSNLGIESIVTAEVYNMPACKFNINVQRT